MNLRDSPRGTPYRLVRDVSPAECWWLSRTFAEGEIVYHFRGPTYGCVKDGIACSITPNEYPFHELPVDALELAS